MLKDKKVLEDYLEKQCDKIVVDYNKCKSIYNYANETYDIPKGIISDLISNRLLMSEVSEFVLFILLDSLYNVLHDSIKISNLDEFYTTQEIKHYKSAKYNIERIKFPLVFKMVQIAEDQWVGKITVDMLMKLRQAQLINYNINAQRTMQRIVRGNKESFKITLNKKAVNSIRNSFESNDFIPNTITLNIPIETEYDFYYDEDSSSLVINSLEHLDISDGFHRYIAAGQVKDKNNNFDYPLELRIVNFTEDKAKQFIYQEDQKTKMTKIDSNAMNMNKAANIVVTRLNENTRCNLKGLISRNEGIISFGDLAEMVDYFYFKKEKVTKEKERSFTIQVVKELTDYFNILTEYNTDYLEHRMHFKTLLVVMFCFNYFKDNNIEDYDYMCKVIEKAEKIIKNSDNTKFRNKTLRKSLLTEVEKIVKEVM